MTAMTAIRKRQNSRFIPLTVMLALLAGALAASGQTVPTAPAAPRVAPLNVTAGHYVLVNVTGCQTNLNLAPVTVYFASGDPSREPET